MNLIVTFLLAEGYYWDEMMLGETGQWWGWSLGGL
jgi:hypothetical protein